MRTRILQALPLFVLLIAQAASAEDASAKEAARLLLNAESTMKSLKGFSCDAKTVRTYPSSHGGATMIITETTKVNFMRPNYFDITDEDSNYPHPVRDISNGNDLYIVSGTNYEKSSIDKTAEHFHWYHNDLLLLLLMGSFDKAVEAPFPSTKTMLPDEDFNGSSCKVVKADIGGGYPVSYKIYIGEDNIVRRIVHTEGSDNPFLMDFSISNFQADPPETASDFQFHPDQTLKPFNLPKSSDQQPLISIGAEAPEFSLPVPSGTRVSLSQALAGKKALLLNFWFVHCPPCRAEHPKLQKFYAELKDRGLGVLAIDDQDTAADVAKYMSGAGLRFTSVLSGPMAAVDPSTGRVNYRGPKLPDYASLVPYGVHWCPTNILLDANGRVVYESDRWDEAGLRKALADLGLQ